MNESELEASNGNRHQARENAREQDTIGFGFVSRWLRKFCEPITERSKAQPEQTSNCFRHS